MLHSRLCDSWRRLALLLRRSRVCFAAKARPAQQGLEIKRRKGRDHNPRSPAVSGPSQGRLHPSTEGRRPQRTMRRSRQPSCSTLNLTRLCCANLLWVAVLLSSPQGESSSLFTDHPRCCRRRFSSTFGMGETSPASKRRQSRVNSFLFSSREIRIAVRTMFSSFTCLYRVCLALP